MLKKQIINKMKNFNKIYTSILLITLTIFTSCTTNDDDFSTIDTGKAGNIQLKFENGFENLGGIVLHKTTQTSANGQKYNFTTLKYIISNITLIDEAGNEYVYHKNNADKGAFIIDQEKAVANIIYVDLKDVPQNKYIKIKFGLGIHQNAYLLGHDGQAQFWDKAKENGMTWSWAAGYVFVKLEGLYGTTEATNPYKNHTGNMGNVIANNTADLYREITLNLPNTARVTSKIKPAIHIMADLNQFLSGEKKLTLNTSTENSMGSSQHLINVTDNLTKMFRVDHVHNNQSN